MGDIFDLFRKIEKPSGTGGPPTHLIVGLGNPGSEYASTRHNVGFLAIDHLAESMGVRIDRVKFHARVCEGVLEGKRVLLMKPETYMNASGTAIGEAAAFYKIPPENVIVLCDDINLAPGGLRIRRKGSAGGHNGLKDIIARLGDAFPRFRIGVGSKPVGGDLIAWVLGTPPKEDREAIAARFPDIAEGISLWLSGKEEEAMNRFSR